MKSTALILFFLFQPSIQAYVVNRADNGTLIKWSSSKRINLNLSTDTANLSTLEVNSIVTESLNEWSSRISNSISLTVSDDRQLSGRNDIYFLNDHVFFNDPSIVAVTEYVVNNSTSHIEEADIILNESAHTFSNTRSDLKYLGNVITHELGHLFGMGHSQVLNSSMFYELRKGQATINGDDDSGIRSLYGSSSLGTISGIIAGGSNAVSVFGAHVSAFSLKKGQIVSASVSDTDGSFKISNLPLDDTYFLYTEPLNNLTSLPDYYNVAKKDYCDSNADYKASFFQRCFGSDRGNPYGIQIDSNNKNKTIGTISIRCGMDVPGDYNRSKGGIYNISLLSSDANSLYVGSSSVGFFNTRVDDGNITFDDEYDEYNLDLSSVDLYDKFPGKSLYLEVQVHTQPFFSPLRLEATLEHIDMAPSVLPNLSAPIEKDDDGNYKLDIKFNIPLYPDRLKNSYTLKLSPNNIDDLYSRIEVAEIFSAGRSFYNENRHFYFITTRLVEKVGSKYIGVSEKNYGEIEDNKSCLDAVSTYRVSGNVAGASTDGLRQSTKKEGNNALACGSITYTDSGPGGGGPLASLIFISLFTLLAIKTQSSRFV